MNLFVTGATGFVGRAFLRRAESRRFESIVCLVRDPSALDASAPFVRAVAGELMRLSPEAESALAGADTVVHLAAQTGKASAGEHLRVNAQGTRALLESCRQAGVPRFILVSTIATTYPEKRHYPYARAKEQAEIAVRESGLDFAILRPTIVFGPESPIGESLAGLATAPVLPLFGGGEAVMHPVHVGDVADALLALVAADPLAGRTIDFGGREAVPSGDFLRRLRRELVGKDGPGLPVPLAPLIALLAGLEKVAGSALPVTAGQFYAFRYDGVASSEDFDVVRPSAERRGVDGIVREIAASHRARAERAASGEVAPPAPAPEPGPEPEPERQPEAQLAREAQVLTRHLIDEPPSAYVIEKYVRAHDPGRHGPGSGAGDRLVSFARRSPFAARLADSWAAVFDRGGVLRRKLALLVAVLESTGSTSGKVDTPDRGGRAGFVLRAALDGFVFLATLLFAVPFLLRPRTGPGRRKARGST